MEAHCDDELQFGLKCDLSGAFWTFWMDKEVD